MNYALVQCVKETTSIEEVNKLLKDDNWRLMLVTPTSDGVLYCLGKGRKKKFRSAVTSIHDQ